MSMSISNANFAKPPNSCLDQLKLLTNRGCLLNCCRNEEHSNLLGDRRESSSTYSLLETSLHRVGVTDAHRSWGLNNLIASGLQLLLWCLMRPKTWGLYACGIDLLRRMRRGASEMHQW